MKGWLIAALVVGALTLWGWHMPAYPQVPAAHAATVQVHQAPAAASTAANSGGHSHHPARVIRWAFRAHRMVRILRHPFSVRRWLWLGW